MPDNQTLLITNLLRLFPVTFIIDGVLVENITLTNNILFVNNSFSVVPTLAEGSGLFAGFHGFLIDNSNYTYATDYELINALNQGMDSLSTLSEEEITLVNDSITSQNAILTEENEALNGNGKHNL